MLYSGLVLATAFSGLIAAGVLSGLDGARGIAGWQWLFIIEGSGSFAAAAIALVVLPDYTDSETGSARWLLNAEDRHVASVRIALDRVSLPETEGSVWSGLWLAVKDVRTWIFVSPSLCRVNMVNCRLTTLSQQVLLLCSNHTAYGFNSFFPT